MLRIVADDKIPFLKGVLEPYANVTYLPGNKIDKKAVEQADALIIRTRTKCNASLLEGTPVRFIATATIGYDHIDTGYCDRNQITWKNAPGCNSSSVMQYIASALVKISSYEGFRLAEKTIGIVGVGNVGKKVEKLARAAGMKVLLNDPPRAREEGPEGFCELETVLSLSDIITLHVPLSYEGTDKTFHLFDEGVFGNLNKKCWLINTSRGEVIDSESLRKALISETIAGAVLDVWENEPSIDTELLDMVFLGTPHIAGYSTDGKANGTSMAVMELSRFFNLPLTGWYPADIPPPPVPVIRINSDEDTETTLRKSVIHTYNIAEDDIKLRFRPADFEKLRGEYPLRREFHAYTVKLEGKKKDTTGNLLRKIGFNLSEA